MAGGHTDWVLALRAWVTTVGRRGLHWRGRRGRNALLEAQHAVLKQIAAGSPLKASLDRICRFVEELDAPALCSVVRLEDDKYLRSLSSPSLPLAYSVAIDGLPIGPQTGSCGTAMWRRRTVVVSDIERDPLWENYRDIARQHGLRACWSKPIVGSAGKILGSFALYYRMPRAPSTRGYEIMEVASELAAVAIERAVLDEQLSISRSRYELAQQLTNLALWQHDFKTGQAYWSPEFRSLLEIPADALPARELAYARVHEEDQQRLQQIHEQAARSGRPYEIQYRLRWHDASIRHISERGAASYAPDGSLQALAGTLLDETERHDATVKLAALAYAAQQVHAQHSLSPLLSFLAESARQLSGAQLAALSVRRGLATVTEYSGELPYAEAIAQALQALQIQNDAMDDRKQSLSYTRGQHDDSLLRRGCWSLPLRTREGAALGWLVVMDKSAGDFTEQDERLLRQLADIAAISVENVLLYAELEARVTERTRELQHSNRELEAFSYSVSHDLRAPLRAISGFATLLTQEHAAQLDAQGQDYLRRINAGTVRMSALIDDLLELGRVSRVHMRRVAVDLSALATSCATRMAEHHANRLVQLEIAPGMQAIADTRLLEVVLNNLLDNAWKFTRDRQPARISVGTERINDEQVFFVADNGAGFDPQYAERLFDPFHRLHSASEFPGTGVGLATVQRIVHRHGGRVFAQGVPGSGATLFFTLPDAIQ